MKEVKKDLKAQAKDKKKKAAAAAAAATETTTTTTAALSPFDVAEDVMALSPHNLAPTAEQIALENALDVYDDADDDQDGGRKSRGTDEGSRSGADYASFMRQRSLDSAKAARLFVRQGASAKGAVKLFDIKRQANEQARILLQQADKEAAGREGKREHLDPASSTPSASPRETSSAQAAVKLVKAKKSAKSAMALISPPVTTRIRAAALPPSTTTTTTTETTITPVVTPEMTEMIATSTMTTDSSATPPPETQ